MLTIFNDFFIAMNDRVFIWQSEVRDYELDSQGIVNNANYLHYFEHARHVACDELGINFMACQKAGIDLTVIETQIKYHRPLQSGDHFTVETQFSLASRLKIRVDQKILSQGQLMAHAQSIVVCLNHDNRKPCMPEEIVKKMV